MLSAIQRIEASPARCAVVALVSSVLGVLILPYTLGMAFGCLSAAGVMWTAVGMHVGRRLGFLPQPDAER